MSWAFLAHYLPADHLRLFSLVRWRKEHRGVDLISDALPFGVMWYGEPDAISNAIGYAKHRSRSHDALIRAYDAADKVIEPHEQAGELDAVNTTTYFRRYDGKRTNVRESSRRS
jgi:hypothetical protein